MKKTTLLYALLCALFSLTGCTDKVSENTVDIIPLPVEIKAEKGQFEWNGFTRIVITDNFEDVKNIAYYLQTIAQKATGKTVDLVSGGTDLENAVVLTIDKSINGNEAYELNVNKKNITIKASQPAGLFYGVQSLLQILPAEIYRAEGLKDGFSIPAVQIKDFPRFAYRGMHLDVSRTFFTKDEVKKFIDLIAMYKFNRFHWHITDGGGWRIEIKKYPLLTQKATFRPQATFKEFWFEGGRKFVDEGTPRATGGYYTQEEVKEVVAYAAEKYITVIPEIEMPGHSEEVFVAYPQFSCSGKSYVNSDFCVGNEETFTFIEDVLGEIIELFPSEYIHIGGDEAAKTAWKTCPKCQKRIKGEKLKDVDELQSYFIKRVARFLNDKGRKLIGWDEIMEGGLDSTATVMLWRDPQWAVRAAEQGNNVIMTPAAYCYFDSYQDDPNTEPEAIGGYLTLSKVYSFEVVQKDSLAKYFIGGQANLWSEWINNFKHVEYMAFPRAIALSETVWSPKESRNWDSFVKRLVNQLPRLDYLDVNYHKPSYTLNIAQKTDIDKKQIEINFLSERYNPVIRYTLDGTAPTENSELYKDVIIVDKTSPLNAAVFENGKAQKIFTRNVGYHKAVGKKVNYHKNWTSYDAGGETALVDGFRGGLNYSDRLWQGFTSNMDVTIDMGETTTLSTFNAVFMQLIGPGVYMPDYVEVSISTDGKKYESVLKVENDVPSDVDRLRFKDFSGSLKGKEARYIKVFAKNQQGYLFVDELVIN